MAHYLEISNTNYSGVEIPIGGSISLDYGSADNPLEAIRGNGLKIILDASLDLDFSELFTSAERTWLVQYQRDSTVLFNGWVTPEGYYEDFVNDKWQVTLDCVDGLSFLEDLSYVDESGFFYTGKQSQLEVIANCLRRTGILQNIYTNIGIYYTGLATTNDILANVYVHTERFVKDDETTIMSCEEVLRDVLEGYAATITMHNGSWFIYKYNQVYNEQSPTFFA